MDYAIVEDMNTLWRTLTPQETTRAQALIPVICAQLRVEAKKYGKDLDALYTSDSDYALLLKSVTVDIVGRTLMTSTDSEPMTQYSQQAMGYSVSGTYLVPGGGVYIKKSELKRLGLARQQIGVIDFYETTGNSGNA